MEPPKSRRILITGASGFVGTALEETLKSEGHRILKVTRSAEGATEIPWDIKKETFDLSPDEEVDAAIHLAGENLASGRWTEKKKESILKSREVGTRLLCKRLVELKQKPAVLVSMSAIHYYPVDTGEPQDEDSPAGEGFLSEVCQTWERETQIASENGIRVINLRLGVVLSPEGGALKQMLPVFRLGLGGALGSGKQMFSWIALDDVLGIIQKALTDDRYQGAINAVAPETVTNREFTKQLGKVLNRPAIVRVPGIALKGAVGEMADAALLSSLHAVPKRLEELEYAFRLPKLEPALRALLKK